MQAKAWGFGHRVVAGGVHFGGGAGERDKPMTPSRVPSPHCVRDARGADPMDETKQGELRILDGVRTGNLSRVITGGC